MCTHACVCTVCIVSLVLEDPQTRDAWWREVRCEIRSHMKVLNCTEVAGYQEYTTI